MRWRDAVWLAFQGVRRRVGRAALTVIAVMLAAALLTALLTISRTAEVRVLEQLAKGGALAGIRVIAAEPDPDGLGSDSPRTGPPKDIDAAALTRIRALPGVRTVSPVVLARQLVSLAGPPPARRAVAPRAENVVGVDLSRSRLLPITVLRGRLPVPGSLSEVAVTEGFLQYAGLARERADALIGRDVLMGAGRVAFDGEGGGVQGRWVRAQIVGVVVQESGAGRILASIESVRAAREWSDSGAGGSAALDGPRSPIAGLIVVAQSVDEVGAVRAGIARLGYATSAPENLIATVKRYLRVVEIVLGGIGVIALAIAALGIANALFAAVRERRREIGVLKAIGARDRDVRRLFLLEASWLGLVGGLLGTLAGWLVARAVALVVNDYLTRQGLRGVDVALAPLVVVGGTFGSMLLAMAAGVVPAARAAALAGREAVDG